MSATQETNDLYAAWLGTTRRQLEAAEQIIAQALACHQRGETTDPQWAARAMELLRLLDQDRKEHRNV